MNKEIFDRYRGKSVELTLDDGDSLRGVIIEVVNGDILVLRGADDSEEIFDVDVISSFRVLGKDESLKKSTLGFSVFVALLLFFALFGLLFFLGGFL